MSRRSPSRTVPTGAAGKAAEKPASLDAAYAKALDRGLSERDRVEALGQVLQLVKAKQEPPQAPPCLADDTEGVTQQARAQALAILPCSEFHRPILPKTEKSRPPQKARNTPSSRRNES